MLYLTFTKPTIDLKIIQQGIKQESCCFLTNPKENDWYAVFEDQEEVEKFIKMTSKTSAITLIPEEEFQELNPISGRGFSFTISGNTKLLPWGITFR